MLDDWGWKRIVHSETMMMGGIALLAYFGFKPQLAQTLSMFTMWNGSDGYVFPILVGLAYVALAVYPTIKVLRFSLGKREGYSSISSSWDY